MDDANDGEDPDNNDGPSSDGNPHLASVDSAESHEDPLGLLTTPYYGGSSSSGSMIIPPPDDHDAGTTPSKYNYLELEEFAKIHSPKVSEMLEEQALALDELMDTTTGYWASGNHGGDDSDYDSDDYDFSGGKRRRKRGGEGRSIAHGR